MSAYDFERATALGRTDAPFASFVMAAALRADTPNLDRLQAAFPELVTEAQRRYDAPGGRLPEDGVPA